MDWSPQQKRAAQVLCEKSYDKARMTSNDGRRSGLYQPRVVSDTLVGFSSQPTEENQATTNAIPVSDIRQVEVWTVSAGKTVLLVAGVGLTVLLIAAAVSASDWYSADGSDTTTSCPVIYSWGGKNWRLRQAGGPAAEPGGSAGDTVRIRLESIPNFWRVDLAGLDASPAAWLTVQVLALDRSGSNDADVRAEGWRLLRPAAPGSQ